jgi:hypothetical protein
MSCIIYSIKRSEMLVKHATSGVYVTLVRHFDFNPCWPITAPGTQLSRCLPPHLRKETDPVSETSCFLVPRIPDDGKSPKTH